MLCDSVDQFITVMRADSDGSKRILCADSPNFRWIGFAIEYVGGTITNNIHLDLVKAWDGCPYVRDMLQERRQEVARLFQENKPFHEGCDHCLVHEVMTA